MRGRVFVLILDSVRAAFPSHASPPFPLHPILPTQPHPALFSNQALLTFFSHSSAQTSHLHSFRAEPFNR